MLYGLLVAGLLSLLIVLWRKSPLDDPKLSKDPDEWVDPDQVRRGLRQVRHGRWVAALLPWVILFTLWQLLSGLRFPWLGFALAAVTLAVSATWTLSGQVQVYRFARPAAVAPALPDPTATQALQVIAAYDRKWSSEDPIPTELDQAYHRLVERYAQGDESLRAPIRRFFDQAYPVASQLGAFVGTLGPQIAGDPDRARQEELLRTGIWAASIVHQDFRETLMLFGPLRRAAEAGGVDFLGAVRRIASDSHKEFSNFVTWALEHQLREPPGPEPSAEAPSTA